MTKPTLHLIGLFHTETTLAHSHCAFTGKVLRFPKMMQTYGWPVIEYGNGRSESEAREKVQILTGDELFQLNQRLLRAKIELPNSTLEDQVRRSLEITEDFSDCALQFEGDTAVISAPAHVAFEARLLSELRKRVRPGDIICHPFGQAHRRLVQDFPEAYHVETGIGYPDAPFGAFRIYETYSWMAWHRGRHQLGHSSYDFVVPNYYDLADWTEDNRANSGPLLYFGRVCSAKGLDTVLALADALQEEILVVGQGDASPWVQASKFIRAYPPVTGKLRGPLLASARALLMPTSFHEPFGGAGVEGMLTGTPLISHEGAAFAETVIPGVTGRRCSTLREWVNAAREVHNFSRSEVAAAARSRYSLAACGQLYDRAFTQITELSTGGWGKL